MANLTLENGSLIYRSQYHPALVTALKISIPDTDRRWDSIRKVWIVDPRHGKTLAQITQQYLGETVTVPTPPRNNGGGNRETRILEVRYIGATKDRGTDDRSAYGYCNGSWSVLFPEKVLREWFAAEAWPEEAQTLYAVLGVARSVDANALKSAYRRLARTWHPDVCKEPDAAEQFKRIGHAYEILSDTAIRAKYDAGLALEASLHRAPQATELTTPNGYRPPLRCGYLICEGTERLGRFQVEKIVAWEDISRGDGRVLVTSWPAGADHFVEVWL